LKNRLSDGGRKQRAYFVAQENRPNGDENKHSNSANCQISSAIYSLAYNSAG